MTSVPSLLLQRSRKNAHDSSKIMLVLVIFFIVAQKLLLY